MTKRVPTFRGLQLSTLQLNTSSLTLTKEGQRIIDIDKSQGTPLTQLSTKHLMSFHIWFSFLVQGILQVHTPDKYSLRQKFSYTEGNSKVMWLFQSFQKSMIFNANSKLNKSDNFATKTNNWSYCFFCTWVYWIRNGVVSNVIQLEDYSS